MEKYMPQPDADPHGGLEAYDEIEDNDICGPGNDSLNISNKNEMH